AAEAREARRGGGVTEGLTMTTRTPAAGEAVQFHQGAQVSPGLAIGHVGSGLRLWVFPADGTAPRMLAGVPHRDWAMRTLNADPKRTPMEMGFWDFVPAAEQAGGA